MHSFVDIITNSSTEIYVAATNKTIKTLKSLIDNLLKLGKSKSTCDDLFTIEIDKERFKEDYAWREESKTSADEFYNQWEKESQDDCESAYKNVYLKVKCRDENNPLGEETSKILSHLTGMFSIESKSEY